MEKSIKVADRIPKTEEFFVQDISEVNPSEGEVPPDIKDLTILHAGTKLKSMTLKIIESHSFQIELGDKKIVIAIENNASPIQFVIPSVEGTVIWCQLEDRKILFYNTISGELLNEAKLRQMDPHFYV